MRILYLVCQPDDCSLWVFDNRPVRVGDRWCVDGEGFGAPIDRFVATMLVGRIPYNDNGQPVCIGVRMLCGDVFRCNADGGLVEVPQFNVIESELVPVLQSEDELF